MDDGISQRVVNRFAAGDDADPWSIILKRLKQDVGAKSLRAANSRALGSWGQTYRLTFDSGQTIDLESTGTNQRSAADKIAVRSRNWPSAGLPSRDLSYVVIEYQGTAESVYAQVVTAVRNLVDAAAAAGAPVELTLPDVTEARRLASDVHDTLASIPRLTGQYTTQADVTRLLEDAADKAEQIARKLRALRGA